MIVQRDGCQGRDVYFELICCRDLRSQFRIKGVYSLKNQYRMFVDPQFFTFIFFYALDLELFNTQLQALLRGEGIKGFIVIIAVFIQWSVFTVYKIIVQ